MQLFLVVSSYLSIVVQDLNHFQNQALVLRSGLSQWDFILTDGREAGLFNKSCAELRLTWGSATTSPQIYLSKGSKRAGSEILYREERPSDY